MDEVLSTMSGDEDSETAGASMLSKWPSACRVSDVRKLSEEYALTGSVVGPSLRLTEY